MKSAVESVNPTRVKLTVEVPFEELKPDLDNAYREIGRQVRISGFRPGKVPARILDQRVGRGAVLEQAMQGAVPRLYGDALRANEVQVVGQPDVEVTKFADGDELVFTAEVDVRPEINLPEYRGLSVTVDDAEVTDEEIDEHLGTLRERFATLTSVARSVAMGDYVQLDVLATIDGEELPGSQATGLSYEVGSNDLMPGLDDAILGAEEGETRTFDSDLTRGEYAGRTAQIAATVRSVKEKELPALDDDFAQTASEFDTIEEMRTDARTRLSSSKRIEQGIQARDRVLAALLEQVDIPLPDSMVAAEVEWRQQNVDAQLAQAGLTKADYLAAENRTEEDFAAEIAESAREAVHSQFVLEAVAGKEEVGVSEAELTDHIVRRARQLNMAPDAFARQVVDGGGLGTLASEVVRGKALALLLENAVITDASGRPVDLNAVSAEYEAAVEGVGPIDDEDEDLELLEDQAEDFEPLEDQAEVEPLADQAEGTAPHEDQADSAAPVDGGLVPGAAEASTESVLEPAADATLATETRSEDAADDAPEGAANGEPIPTAGDVTVP